MILNDFSLHGKVAIVTGCNTGLGKSMATGLAQAGCDIVALNRSDPVDTAAQITAMGRQFLSLKANLLQQNALPAMLEHAVKEMGHIDILVNNAGLIRREDAVNFNEQDWDDVMNVNIKTVFFLSQWVARQFIAQGKGGKIINIASMLSFQGGIRVPSYTASKSALIGLTRELANEWARYNINVNTLAPGYFSTNNTEMLRKDETRREEIVSRIPAGRWGQPDDLAGPAVFLASKASDYINGFTLAVDGGWLAR
ncbi:2-dehydro-3-deoxy-D-gluconate 5-dehydrogenase KduD [Erwinia tracheiphila]|uniref:2-dehydro-3-deoxy-D-gluconate 5-dehydrogenase n=1 Tax=Erwinia tracheiphila TaxID=65700 RepID=A0A0M2KBM9_9GAMM|nr:2-dehydro-3-deoxy-D-gluconate 5-dehydrogenase KduD [Erwinia tracheiphila]EOS94479.1 2-deoxy-D-gluconate 3-dehydrogenase [Erwinia tracheiphila PSU-1]KKF36765.1 2-deoxy-D-gluconate 3-dehydrogenase [Erwinia tracheiphila]UIA88100.1 2-dehydro-3-deoxy-D-gluconate 5-dehydrogenase KduD [Erwinia tracheiphila]UIA96693.1 2-dehydro-3-deoxy-D-gluconate 5-dehydrogenase KduD [Erwinia tracheiphila]